MMSEFEKFPKIARLNREIVITEKIDGTNAQIHIALASEDSEYALAYHNDFAIYAGSRSRWITVKDDNFGFARWVTENAQELIEKLGHGAHYGEWWGAGIQRRYDMNTKAFSLFNTFRWNLDTKPSCCSVVPVLYQGPFDQDAINDCLAELADVGSYASPRYKDPEGIVIFHTAANTMFKVTLKDDESPKGLTHTPDVSYQTGVNKA
jgi:RNA ligase